MIQVDGLAEVVLNVRDASRSVAFYGDLLGLERITPDGQAGPIFAYPRSSFSFLFRQGPRASRNRARCIIWR